MTLSTFSPSLRRTRPALTALLMACMLAAPGIVRAQEDNPPPRELEERTSADLDKLKPLLDEKKWNEALALVQGIRKRVGPKSYDMAIASDVEAKVYLQKGEYAKALEPWEAALQLGESYKFFERPVLQEMIYFLAQLYYQEATTSKNPAVQKQYFAKATDYLKRWKANSNKPPFDASRAEASMFFANVLYQQAVTDPQNVNTDLIKQAETEVQEALRLSARPKESAYLILLAISQQQGNWTRLGELLELLVKQYPGKKDYWSQLAGVYSTLAGLEKDETKAREYNTRAILAIERAQALGFMKTPKENYSLFGMYFNVGQFGRATEILHSGLRDGSIESDQKNWELLASSYQQVDKPFAAIEALQEGSKKFPKSGQLDYQIATIYYSMNKTEEAFKYGQIGLSKGGLERPGTAYGFMAYVSYELGKWSEALEAVQKALTYPDGKRDTQLPQLRNAIEEKLREREAAQTVASTR